MSSFPSVRWSLEKDATVAKRMMTSPHKLEAHASEAKQQAQNEAERQRVENFKFVAESYSLTLIFELIFL